MRSSLPSIKYHSPTKVGHFGPKLLGITVYYDVDTGCFLDLVTFFLGSLCLRALSRLHCLSLSLSSLFITDRALPWSEARRFNSMV